MQVDDLDDLLSGTFVRESAGWGGCTGDRSPAVLWRTVGWRQASALGARRTTRPERRPRLSRGRPSPDVPGARACSRALTLPNARLPMSYLYHRPRRPEA